VQRIKALGKHAGVAINPATPAAVLEEMVQDVDLVLVMTVNPGFGHQQFIRTTLSKIARVRELVERLKPGCEVEHETLVQPPVQVACREQSLSCARC
jgi:ribulose-phosphate 3-epimerase